MSFQAGARAHYGRVARKLPEGIGDQQFHVDDGTDAAIPIAS